MNQTASENASFDVRQVGAEELAEKPFPVERPFRVFMEPEAHRAIWEHARDSLRDEAEVREVGGLLVGEVYRDREGPYLHIRGAIAAEHTRSEGTEVTFTPQTWVEANRLKDELYPELRMVGWYHTHPKFGIFLSERDKFVHQHSFPQPWATAFVVDPVEESEGIFLWREGDLTEASEFWVGQDRKPAFKPPRKPTSTSSQSERPLSRRTLVTATLVGLLLLAALSGGIYLREKQSRLETEVIVRTLQSQGMELDRLFQILRALAKEVDSRDPSRLSRDSEIQHRLKQFEARLNRLDDLTRSLRQTVDSPDPDPSTKGNATP